MGVDDACFTSADGSGVGACPGCGDSRRRRQITLNQAEDLILIRIKT